MSILQLIFASTLRHGRVNAAVALGVAAATAVLTGALLVGDSVRGSLQDLVRGRLQGVEEALVLPRFFRAELADELQRDVEERDFWSIAVVLVEGTIEDPVSHRRVSHAGVIGAPGLFFDMASTAYKRHAAPTEGPAPGEVFLNQALADDLRVAVGGDCIVRLPVARETPADSPLGRKTETVSTLRLRVARILNASAAADGDPAAQMESFSLRPNQAPPKNAFLNLQDAQRALEQPGKVNAILCSGIDSEESQPAAGQGTTPSAPDKLQSMLHPTLADYGLSISDSKHGYFLLESDRMLLEPAAVEEAERAFASLGARPAFTYLANTLADGEREIPYSTVSAIDFTTDSANSGFQTAEGKPATTLKDNEIALSAWAAEDLQAKPGDTIRVTYFEPESTHGNVVEKTVELRLAEIIALSGAADDPRLTPTLPGVTDQLSIADWNPPFPFESERIRPRDETYWDDHKATPKAFVSLTTGRKLWGSRFGDTTSLRIPGGDDRTADNLAARLAPDPLAMGFEFRPVKKLALQASAGTTPFEFLFLGFSFFIIVAALALVAILFRLGIDGRVRDVGLLLAMGWPLARIRRVLLAEGLMVAAAGAAVGVALGIGYAWLMIVGLTTWWVAAITAPFLRLHVTPATLPLGALAGMVTSGIVIYRSLARLRKQSVRALLAGQTEPPVVRVARGSVSRWVARGGLVLALVIGLFAMRLSGEAQAGAFFGSGFLVLIALLGMVIDWLRAGGGKSVVSVGRAAIARLALRNAGRHPGRSTLTIGLIAAASFLIIAISAFRIDPNADVTKRESGTGGFALVAESDQPIYQDLNDEDGQLDLGFSSADRKQMVAVKVLPLRVAAGDDASCLNLYQALQPRVLGVPKEMADRGGFAWAGTSAATPEEKANPWLLLDEQLPQVEGTSVTPVILDVATAKYALHLSGVGATYEITDGRGRPLRLQVVGLLAGSVLQGSLLMGEQAFLQHFPDTSGYRFFLIDAPANASDALGQMLEGKLGDFGFDVESAPERLAEYSAVQNTYLSTFQSLGGLGLLLGTIGLAAVQLRNVSERRGEMALLRAAGFRRALVARMVLWENALLLVGGLAVGCLAALVALAPHLIHGAAKLPWTSVTVTLALVLAVGLTAGMVAVAAAVRAPILATLRGE